jgi:hypothetical protein
MPRVPGLTEQRRVVHQDLAVHAHHVEQADVAGEERGTLLVREVVFAEQLVAVRVEALAHERIAVELI